MSGVNPFSKPSIDAITKLNSKKGDGDLKVTKLHDIIADSVNARLEEEEMKLQAEKQAKKEEEIRMILELKEKEKIEKAVERENERKERLALREKKKAETAAYKENERRDKLAVKEKKRIEVQAEKEEKRRKRETRAQRKAEKETERAEWRRMKEFRDGVNIDEDGNYSVINTVKDNTFIIPLNKIIAFYAEDKYMIINHKGDDGKTVSATMPYALNKVEEEICDASCTFTRVHRNALINAGLISGIRKEVVSGNCIEDFKKRVINFQLTNKMNFDDVIGNIIDVVSLEDNSLFAVSRRKFTELKRMIME